MQNQRNANSEKPGLEYLGHLITAKGIKPNRVKIEAIKNFKKLENVKDV